MSDQPDPSPGDDDWPAQVDFGPFSSSIVRLGRAHRALAGQLMREVGLRPEQGALMMHLWSVGPLRQTALATHFGRDSAATTRAVQRLEKAGFVRRRTDPLDRRATLVEPTTAGNALRGRVEALWERLERVAVNGLDPVEREVALRLLRTLGDVVTAELTAEATKNLNQI